MTRKTCTRCKEAKPMERFTEGKNTCKDCLAIHSRNFYERQKELRLQEQRRFINSLIGWPAPATR